MLEDFASTPPKVRYSMGWGSASLKRDPARVMVTGTSMGVSGSTMPLPMVAATLS